MEKTEQKKITLVYCVIRYGQLNGCYEKIEDAAQVQPVSIAKGQICDLVVKPLLISVQNG